MTRESVYTNTSVLADKVLGSFTRLRTVAQPCSSGLLLYVPFLSKRDEGPCLHHYRGSQTLITLHEKRMEEKTFLLPPGLLLMITLHFCPLLSDPSCQGKWLLPIYCIQALHSFGHFNSICSKENNCSLSNLSSQLQLPRPGNILLSELRSPADILSICPVLFQKLDLGSPILL